MLKNRSNHGVDCFNCSVNYLCVVKNLEDNEIRELNNSLIHFQSIAKGQHIFHSSDKMNNLYAVRSGSCKDYWLDEQGDERIGNFYLPGDLIGLESLPNRTHFFSMTALEDTELCVIPIDSLFQLMQKYPNLLKRIINITSYKMQNDQYIKITTNANERVANFILNILYRFKERNVCEDYLSLPMSQFDVSNFLGMAHETVSRIFRKFEKENIIKIENKKIYIVNMDRLKGMCTNQNETFQLDH